MCGKQDGLVFSLFLLMSLDHVAEAFLERTVSLEHIPMLHNQIW